jgi:hypothetical protein
MDRKFPAKQSSKRCFISWDYPFKHFCHALGWEAELYEPCNITVVDSTINLNMILEKNK